MNKKGTISVNTENIFPIIKKFLYSDHEVFLRELVANAVDATQKLQQLASAGAFEGKTDTLKIRVTINEKLKTITISDQGIGMTADEIERYINQVAFSGATEFVEKYKDQGDPKQLIGFFGLGFYAAFMVASKVEIISRSYQKDSEAAHWKCDGTTSFELSKAVKKEIGTDIILHIAQDSEEFLQPSRIQQILSKYCKFLPVEIEFEDKVINNPTPVWTQKPSELKDEDYLSFYKELYPFAPDPLFWIHLNVDYPFQLTGVLYFPQVTNHFEQRKNQIQLYARQVFITDEVQNVVPEFLMLLHGVIDSPDIPLNVSRSALQTDSNVRKINTYITKKVADKLAELFKADRKAYEEKWSGIEFFVKYGMLSEDKFYEKAEEFALFQNTAKEYFTLKEYQDKIRPQQTDKDQNLIMLYTAAPEKQDIYVQSCQKRGYDVLLMNQLIDTHFVGSLERKLDNTSLKSVDSDIVEKLIDKGEETTQSLTEEEQKQLQALYEQAMDGNRQVTWSVVTMSAEELPVVVTIPEFAKRMQALSKMSNLDMLPLQAAINANHPLAQKLLQVKEPAKQQKIAHQAFDLALLAHNMLQGAALTSFIQQNIALITGTEE